MTVEILAPAPCAAPMAWLLRRREILGWWLASRATVFAAAIVVHATGDPDGYFGRAELSPPLGVLRAWDGVWYARIAAHGYVLVPGRQSDPAFFPLFPILTKLLHPFGLSYGAAGIVLSNLAFLVGVLALFDLGKEWLPDATARRAAVLAALFPLGYTFSMSYPEGVVFAALALATLAAVRGHWGAAAALGAVAALARPEGVFLALPLAALAWSQRRRLGAGRAGIAAGAVVAPPAALLSFPVYLGHVLHDSNAWSQAETGWGRRFTPGGALDAVTGIPALVAHNGWLARDVVFFCVSVVALALAWRTAVPRAWTLAGAAMVLLPIGSGSFASAGRFGLLALPVYWGVASAVRSRRADLALRVASLALLAAATVAIPCVFP